MEKREKTVQRKLMAEAVSELLTDERRGELARALVEAMPKSPEWYKLGLALAGEAPGEKRHVEVAVSGVEQYLSALAQAGGTREF